MSDFYDLPDGIRVTAEGGLRLITLDRPDGAALDDSTRCPSPNEALAW